MIGEYKDRIEVIEETSVDDGEGGQTVSTTSLYSVYADVKLKRYVEQEAGGRVSRWSEYEVRTRYAPLLSRPIKNLNELRFIINGAYTVYPKDYVTDAISITWTCTEKLT